MRVIESEGDSLVLELEDESDTVLLGEKIAKRVSPGVVLGLIGTLGAGKTRLSRAIAEALAVEPSAIASPTFVLIHEYDGSLPVYHFDTYRLTDPDEFEALGASEYWLRGDGLCLIEWADRVRQLLPMDCWIAEFAVTGQESRRVRLTIPNQSQVAEWLGIP